MGGGGGQCANLGGWQGWVPLRNGLIQLGSGLLRALLGCEQLPELTGTVDEPHGVPSRAAVEAQDLRFFSESCGCHVSQKGRNRQASAGIFGGRFAKKSSQSWRCGRMWGEAGLSSLLTGKGRRGEAASWLEEALQEGCK